MPWLEYRASRPTPYTINFSLALERQLSKSLTGTLSYIHTRGVHQFRLRNINAPLSGPPSDVDVRPVSGEGDRDQVESAARSVFHGINAGFNRRFSQRLIFFGTYSLSWTMDDSDGAMSLPADNYDLRSEWGRASTDRRHSFFTGFFLTMPLGFRVNSIINASSGTPFNITTGGDDNGDLTINDRPAGIHRNADLPATLYSQLPDRLICRPGTTPASTSGGGCNPGSAPLIQLREFLKANYPDGVRAIGPGSFTVNLYASKSFGLGARNGPTAQSGQGASGGGRQMGGTGSRASAGSGESARFNVTFAAGCANLFNRVNYGQFGGVIGSTYFGIPSSSGPARQMDFNVRFNF